MVDKYPNRVAQLTVTTGSATVLVLGDVPPPFARGLDTMFTAAGETAIVQIVDGLNYQVAGITWNGDGTVTRGASFERMEGGTYTASTGGTAGHLSLSGGARIVAGQGRQALLDYLGDQDINLAGLTVLGNASFDGYIAADTLQSLTGDTVTVDDDLDVNGNITAIDGTYRSTRNISALLNQSAAVTRFLDLDFLNDNGGTCNFRIGRGTNNAGDVVFQLFRGNGTTDLTFQVDRNGALILGNLNLPDLPTSSSGLSSGDVWRDTAAGNVLKQVP